MRVSPKRVAVIVLNYNGRDLLGESLGSLSKQNYPNYRLYLLDDCSTDGSIDFVKRTFPKVKVIKTPKRLGITRSSNYAVLKTTGELVVLMSNDMKFDKNCVAELVKTITDNKPVGICGSVLICYDKDPESGQHLTDNVGGDLDIYGFGMQRDWGKPFATYSKEVQEAFFSYGGSFIIRRSLFKKIGGFDRLFWGLSDDIDLSWRVRLLGYKVVVNPRSFLYHHISPTLGRNKRSESRYLSERNSLRMMLKNYSTTSLLKIFPRYLFLELGEICFYLFRGRIDLAFSIVKAFTWNIAHLVDTLQARAKIQNTRVVRDEEILSKMSYSSHKFKIFPSAFREGII